MGVITSCGGELWKPKSTLISCIDHSFLVAFFLIKKKRKFLPGCMMRIDQVDHWIDGLANPSESSPGWAKVETLNIRGSSKTQECWGHNQVKPGALHKCALDKCCPYFSALNLAQVPPVCLLTPMFLPFPVQYIPHSLPLFTPFPHFFYCLQ